MAKKKVWETLSTKEQQTLISNLDDNELSNRFDKKSDFFVHARQFFSNIPKQTVDPTAIPHNPPKDLVISARRDLSFYEATFELFDNSIDKWRSTGAKRNLTIDVDYDLELLTAVYEDDAGGMDEGDVYKVFIPGETTNRDFSKNVIGSFGMGAKKGIFRLTDGAKVVSCRSASFSATSEVPEKWELSPNWETLDGRAKSIGEGTTRIYFYKLFSPPSQADIDELIRKTGVTYRPLLAGELLRRRIIIKINDVPVEPAPAINWSDPKGAGPRMYEFSNTFRNFLQTGSDITLEFQFRCGLTQKIPGKGAESPDWGVDVYGNGRAIERFLKEEFGFGTTGLGTNTVGHRFFRGELFINGHSFAIPWDTHKREYMHDHPVSAWLRRRLRDVIKSYADIGRRFADDTPLRHSELEATSPEDITKIPTIRLETDVKPTDKALPEWAFKPKKKDAVTAHEAEESKAKLAEREEEEHVVTLVFGPVEFDELLDRFAVTCEEELGTALRDCVISGVTFSLEAKLLKKALSVFKCDGSVGELSESIKKQLVKKLST